MDPIPIPTSVTGGVAGALAAHQVARQELAKRIRRRRAEERSDEVHAEEAHADAPVAQANAPAEITADVRQHLDATPRPPLHKSREDRPVEHIDVVG